jgi:hypothetical protein
MEDGSMEHKQHSRIANSLRAIRTATKIIAIFHILIFTFSCAQEKQNYFLPLSVGLTWEYSIKVTEENTIKEGNIVDKIEGIEIINNIEYFRLVSNSRGIWGDESNTAYYRRTDDAILMYSIDEKSGVGEEHIAIPLPVETGKNWEIEYPTNKMMYKIESIMPYEVNGKEYENCLIISWKGQYTAGIRYYAQGIGLVAAKSTGPNYETELNLIKY